METGKADGLKPPLYVVRIAPGDGHGPSGTGFIVSEAGHVATCLHVVRISGQAEPLAELRVKLPYPAEQPYVYRVLAYCEEDDIALLESKVPLDVAVPPFAMLHDHWERDTGCGDAVTVWGYSAAEHYTQAQRFDGHVSGLSGPHGRIGLAMDVNPGDSGGPVLDAHRRVIGIAQARDAVRNGQAMAIPVSRLRELLHRQGVSEAPVPETDAKLAPPTPPDYALVGRGSLIETIKRDFDEGRHVALCFKPGVGKSALAIALANDPQLRARFQGVLWASLNVVPNVMSELKGWAERLRLPADQMEALGQRTTIGDADDIARWGEALAQHIGQRSMLLVVDDAWQLEPAKALLLKAPHCRYLVTTREQTKVAAMLGDDFATHIVDELSEQDSLDFLRELAPNAVAMFPDKALDVARSVGGLPQGLLLLGKYLRQESASVRRRRIEGAFDNVLASLEEHTKPLQAAIRVGYDALPSDTARWALRALSIFRAKPDGFSEASALAVLELPPSVIDELSDSGLIEPLPRRKHDADDDDPPYTMHRTIDDFATALLPANEAQKLHRRAADHFASLLTTYETDEGRANRYSQQYRYENLFWQCTMDDFLYHLARAGDPTLAVMAFGHIYFSAFWWWGCFTSFPFCTRLLKQAASKRLTQEARAALELLTAFDAAYPKEGAASREGDWATVERSLRRLRELGQLEDDAVTARDARAKQVRALTGIFLAEALRFGRSDLEGAEALYRDALTCLEADDWSAPWVYYHLAHMHLEAGRHDRARSEASEALALAEKSPLMDRDFEVIANAWCLFAALSADAGDAQATRHAADRAVLHAYAFQVVPVVADDYTQLFYRQVVGRVVDALVRLRRRDVAAAQACCAGLRADWKTYRGVAQAEGPDWPAHRLESDLDQAGANGVATYLFPPAPPDPLPHDPGDRYFNEARMVFNVRFGTAQERASAQ